jgi:hypothetical protein
MDLSIDDLHRRAFPVRSALRIPHAKVVSIADPVQGKII